MRLIDSHCHLNADRFAGDEAAVLDRSRVAGVERILVPGWNLASSERALALADRFDGLDVSVGVHPHDAAKVDEAGWRQIRQLARDPRVVAIGETGLDYDRVFSPVADQLTNLRRNLELALETGKPAILHVRSAAGRSDAQDAILAELRDAGFGTQTAMSAFGSDRPSAVIHSFSGSVDYARRVLDLGLAISISGLAFRVGEEVTADVGPLVPADRLLVETDSPFLSPPGGPRGRNEPEWVRITAAWVGERRGIGPDELGAALVAAYDTRWAGTKRAVTGAHNDRDDPTPGWAPHSGVPAHGRDGGRMWVHRAPDGADIAEPGRRRERARFGGTGSHARDFADARPGASAGAEDGVFRTVHVSVDGSGELPVVLQDLTGLIVGVDAVAQGEPPFDERVSNPAGQPNVLRYQWIGGACDTLTSITLERLADGFRLVDATTTTGGFCIAIGVFRGIDIHLSEPVDHDSVIIGNR